MLSLRQLVLSARLLILATTWLGAQPFSRDARTLLLDHLDESFTPDGQQQTTAAVITPTADWKGGRITKGTRVRTRAVRWRPGDERALQSQLPSGRQHQPQRRQTRVLGRFQLRHCRGQKGTGRAEQPVFLDSPRPGLQPGRVYSTLGYTNVAVETRRSISPATATGRATGRRANGTTSR